MREETTESAEGAEKQPTEEEMGLRIVESPGG